MASSVCSAVLSLGSGALLVPESRSGVRGFLRELSPQGGRVCSFPAVVWLSACLCAPCHCPFLLLPGLDTLSGPLGIEKKFNSFYLAYFISFK